jgi:hypothetical protein
MSDEVPRLIQEAREITRAAELLQESGIEPSTILRITNIALAKLETASDSMREEQEWGQQWKTW